MSNEELYEIARRRIDRRNRRWMWWAVDLAGLILSVAFVVLSDSFSERLSTTSVSFMLAWGGIFVLHTIILAMAQSRDADIEKEIIKLREADAAMYYEKPKRPYLTDDGEIVDLRNWQHDEAERHLKA